jgi:hypothetical protein
MRKKLSDLTPEERKERVEYYGKRISFCLVVMILALIALLFLWLFGKITSDSKEEKPRRPANYAFCPRITRGNSGYS